MGSPLWQLVRLMITGMAVATVAMEATVPVAMAVMEDTVEAMVDTVEAMVDTVEAMVDTVEDMEDTVEAMEATEDTVEDTAITAMAAMARATEVDMEAMTDMEAMDTDPAMEDIESFCNNGCEYRFYVVLLNR